jgi:uncharacterized membrane protein YphA (DoxX/SURF4 family)
MLPAAGGRRCPAETEEATMTARATLERPMPRETAVPGAAHRGAAAARILLGLTFLVMGLNGFLNFLPQPSTPMPAGAVAFSLALAKTGYMLPLVMGTQALAGALLLANRFVPLALALLAPVIVNILAFHLFLMPSWAGPGIVALVLEIYLVWVYRGAFRPMLAVRTRPGAP